MFCHARRWKCHVLSWSSVSVPFSPPPACGAGPCFARIAPACPRASPPARFARLIARAREAERRAHVSRAFPRAFFAPARTGGNRPRADAGPFLPPHIGAGSPEVKPYSGIISTLSNKQLLPVERQQPGGGTAPGGGTDRTAPESCGISVACAAFRAARGQAAASRFMLDSCYYRAQNCQSGSALRSPPRPQHARHPASNR